MSISEGVPMYQILQDLRSVKLPSSARKRVLEIHAKFKGLSEPTHEEFLWLHAMYNRHAASIRQLREARSAVIDTNARHARGTKRDAELRKKAVLTTRKRLKKKLERLKTEMAEDDEERKDFGF